VKQDIIADLMYKVTFYKDNESTSPPKNPECSACAMLLQWISFGIMCPAFSIWRHVAPITAGRTARPEPASHE